MGHCVYTAMDVTMPPTFRVLPGATCAGSQGQKANAEAQRVGPVHVTWMTSFGAMG